MVSVKFEFNNDVRRVDIEPKKKNRQQQQDSEGLSLLYPSLNRLHKVARHLYSTSTSTSTTTEIEEDSPTTSIIIPFPEEFVLRYTDDEGDLITVTSNKEVEEAFRCMKETCNKVPKFLICDKNITTNNNNDSIITRIPTKAVIEAASQAIRTLNDQAQKQLVLLQQQQSQWKERIDNMNINLSIPPQVKETVHEVVDRVSTTMDRVSGDAKKLASQVQQSVRVTIDKIKKDRRYSYLQQELLRRRKAKAANNNNNSTENDNSTVEEGEDTLVEEESPEFVRLEEEDEEEPLLKNREEEPEEPEEEEVEQLEEESEAEESEEDEEDYNSPLSSSVVVEETMEDEMDLKVKQLEEMGFTDREKNRQMLAKYDGDTVNAILELLDGLNQA